VEDVAGDEDQVGPLLQDVIHGPLEHFCDVRLTLIRALGRLPIKLAEAEVKVSEVGELQLQ
jgi:hypothetical protein